MAPSYTQSSYASYFGASESVERMTIEESVDMIKYVNGLNETEWPRTRTETISKDKVFYEDWGTCPDTDATNNTFGCVIDSLTHTMTERIGSAKEVGSADFNSCPGSIPQVDAMKLLVLTKGLIWLGVDHTISIEGKFKGIGAADTLLRELMTEGGRITKPMKLTGAGLTANGAFELTPNADNPFTQPAVRSVRYECTRDWTKFSVELGWFEPVTAETMTESPLAGELDTFVAVPALSDWYKITKTVTLSSSDNPRVTESIEFYEDGTSGGGAKTDVLISQLAGTANLG